MTTNTTPKFDRPISRRQVLLAGAALALVPGGCADVPNMPAPFANRAIRPTRTYARVDYPVLYRRPQPLSSPSVRYPGFKPETLILPKGSVRRPGALPLPCDILLERDVAVPMRDGTVIYTDILRPPGDEPSPVIVVWSPYGKELGASSLDDVPNRAGVPLSSVSGLQKFEGPDPAYWVAHGYAVAHPDARGAFKSAGNISCWGRQTAEDGYDFVEWCSAQPWSTGRIALAGTSWLCISQWFIASERPPHLTCIAPWEGMTDAYRDTMIRGGIATPFQRDTVLQNFGGEGLLEDVSAMSVTHPFLDDYWDDKMARLEHIEVPAYVVACYTNGSHTHGSFEGYRRIGSRKKWLRVHNRHEWPDLYEEVAVEDMRRFFDHFLKDQDNGWERTPAVRLSVLDPGGYDIVGRPEAEFPLARTQYHKLYLTSGAAGLDWQAPHDAATVRYGARDDSEQRFAIRFDQETEITGYMNLCLWVEAEGSDDMDIDVSVRKLNRQGKLVTASLSYPNPINSIVASGRLRVSMRAIDPKRSTEAEPYLTFRHEARLSAGQVVPVQISLWPMSLRFHPGEALELAIRPFNPVDRRFMDMGKAPIPVPMDRFTVSPGENAIMKEFGGERDPLAASYTVHSPPSRNAGTHIIHLGADRPSCLLVPIIPSGRPAPD